MYCSNCGNEFEHNDKFCGKCGNPNPKYAESNTNEVSKSSSTTDPNTEKILYGVVGFAAPLIGLILSLATKKDHPEAAKIGIIVSCIMLVVRLAYFIIMILVNVFTYI